MARIGVQVEVTEESTKQNDYTNLPNGIYKLEIIASDVPESGEGTAEHKLAVNTTVEVMEPEQHKGRRFFSNYNLVNPSIKNGKRMAEDIGKRQYACLVRAVGLSEAPYDSEDLHLRPFYAKVGVGNDYVGNDGKKREGRNDIKGYFYPTDDQGNEVDPPEVKVDAVQPAPAAAAPARVQAPANDNRQGTAAVTRPAGAKPWGKK